MKQGKFIDQIALVARECGQRLIIENNRRGVHLSTPNGSVHFGPDRHQEIHQRHYNRYFKNLGLPRAALGG